MAFSHAPRHRLGVTSAVLLLAAPLLVVTPASGQDALRQSPPAILDAPAKKNAKERDEARRQQGNLVGHGGPVKSLSLDVQSGRILTGSFDYAMMAWDLSGDIPTRIRRFDAHNGTVNAVTFLPGGKAALAGVDDGTAHLWDVETGEIIHRFAGHKGKIVGLALSPDGRWAATASWDHTVRVWDLEKREAGPVLKGHSGPVNAVAFSSNGDVVYSASADGTIGIWSRSDGSFKRPLYKHGWGINVLHRLPVTDQLVFGALDGSIAIVDGHTGALVRELPAHARPVLALAVLEKPGLIASASADGVIRVFRAADGSTVAEHSNPYGLVWSLAFRADGQSLYFGGLDDFAQLWRIGARDAGAEMASSPLPRRFQKEGKGDSLLDIGELQFARKCSVCHTLTPDGANRAGPTLHGVFGRRIGTLPGYPFSDALKKLEIVWSAETIDKLFALGPDEFTPGSKMPLQVMTDAKQRAALIAYLEAATAPPRKPSGPTDQRAPTSKVP